MNNVRDKLVSKEFITAAEFDSDIGALENHLARPEVLVTSHMFYRLSGRVPL